MFSKFNFFQKRLFSEKIIDLANICLSTLVLNKLFNGENVSNSYFIMSLILVVLFYFSSYLLSRTYEST
jgi:hypothetical protein